ncbi:radical SAM protein, partial [Campylobacter jejuni]
DKHCTYCIVPHTRGDEISIPFNIIYKEAQKAVEKGAKEIFLLGQNVNNYGKRFRNEHKKMDFSDLLEELSTIEDLERIRFTSPHPLHMDDKFLEVFANNPKVCKSM